MIKALQQSLMTINMYLVLSDIRGWWIICTVVFLLGSEAICSILECLCVLKKTCGLVGFREHHRLPLFCQSWVQNCPSGEHRATGKKTRAYPTNKRFPTHFYLTFYAIWSWYFITLSRDLFSFCRWFVDCVPSWASCSVLPRDGKIYRSHRLDHWNRGQGAENSADHRKASCNFSLHQDALVMNGTIRCHQIVQLLRWSFFDLNTDCIKSMNSANRSSLAFSNNCDLQWTQTYVERLHGKQNTLILNSVLNFDGNLDIVSAGLAKYFMFYYIKVYWVIHGVQPASL